jgi:hypothetical protein
MLLFTGRTEDWGSVASSADLSGQAAVRRLRLQRLAAPEVEALVASAIEIGPDERRVLAQRLHAESGGNPFYVIELLTALVEEEYLTPDAAGVWHMPAGFADRPLPLPASVREVVAHRLAHLSDSARAVAGAGASVGVPFAPSLIAELTGLAPTAVAAALDELILHRVVRQAPSAAGVYEFSHELVRRYVCYAFPLERTGASGGGTAAASPASASPIVRPHPRAVRWRPSAARTPPPSDTPPCASSPARCRLRTQRPRRETRWPTARARPAVARLGRHPVSRSGGGPSLGSGGLRRRRPPSSSAPPRPHSRTGRAASAGTGRLFSPWASSATTRAPTRAAGARSPTCCRRTWRAFPGCAW